MSDPASLLPPNATPQERALDLAPAAHLGAIPRPISRLWNPQTCPAALLPWLAWALSVDEWDADWPEQIRRDVIAGSIGLHRVKGTLAALKRALAGASMIRSLRSSRLLCRPFRLHHDALPKNTGSPVSSAAVVAICRNVAWRWYSTRCQVKPR